MSRIAGKIVALAGLWALPSSTAAEDLLAAWAARAARVDSLYVEGRITHYAVPAELDAADPRNWTVNPETCPINEFKLWLRRPDFRIEVRRSKPGQSSFSESHYVWLDGKLYLLGGLEGPPEDRGANILETTRSAPLLKYEPFLTPLEYHFFEWPQDNVPALCPDKPHHQEGDAVTIQFSHEAPWIGRIEFDPARQYCPKRMRLLIDPDRGPAVTWDLETLETQMVGGIPVISKARMVLYSPRVIAAIRTVRIWEATRIEQRPITRADLELVFPPGTPVSDLTTHKGWIAGDPTTVRDLDMELLRKVSQAMQAQLVTPEIRARRTTAMRWIIVGAGAVTLLVAGLAYRIRQLRRGSAG